MVDKPWRRRDYDGSMCTTVGPIDLSVYLHRRLIARRHLSLAVAVFFAGHFAKTKEAHGK